MRCLYIAAYEVPVRTSQLFGESREEVGSDWGTSGVVSSEGQNQQWLSPYEEVIGGWMDEMGLYVLYFCTG